MIKSITNMIELLMVAPANDLAPELRPLIESWDRPIPKAAQIADVLFDISMYSLACSDFVIGILTVLHEDIVELEKTNPENT